MFRLLVLGSGILSAAQFQQVTHSLQPSPSKGACVLDSAEAISDAMDAAVYIWAATKRCGTGANEKVRCTIDAFAAIEAVGSMAEAAVGAVTKCSTIRLEHTECGVSAGDLASRIAAMAKSSSQIYQRCPEWKNPKFVPESDIKGTLGCVVDLKNTAKGLAKVISAVSKTRKECKRMGSWQCNENIIGVLGALSGMGEWIAGSVGDCAQNTLGKKLATKAHALCVQGASGLLEELTKISQDSVVLSKTCRKAEATRLYEQQAQMENNGEQGPKVKLVLLALLPAAAFVGFVGGRRHAGRYQVDRVQGVELEACE